ncbi:hypothetical protein [Jeotgalibacillus malaysiensis]|uniref:hypothetical protein n=1 Tax=Jeotgalibacillus malaysiensis TaxID=1508404 RepID=UPI00384E1916
MTFLVQIVPIALMLIILTLFFKRREQLKPKKPRKSLSRLLRTRMLYFIYAGVLLLAMAAYYILPEPAEGVGKAVPEEESLNYYVDLYDPAQQNRFDEIDPEFLVEQKQYDFSGDRLNIPAPMYGSSYGDTLFAVTKDEEVDGEVLIDMYETPVVLNGFDITDAINRAEVKIAYDTLNVETPVGSDRLKFNQFNPPAPAQQFLKGERADLASGFSFAYGIHVIHLRVPAHIEIEYAPEANVVEFTAQ